MIYIYIYIYMFIYVYIYMYIYIYVCLVRYHIFYTNTMYNLICFYHFFNYINLLYAYYKVFYLTCIPGNCHVFV